LSFSTKKLLNLQKAFETRQDRLLPAFKIGELALAGFQNQRVGSGRLSKALGAALRNLLSNRSKGVELAGFKKLFANSKGFRAKLLRIK
jgi:hypothetical protein